MVSDDTSLDVTGYWYDDEPPQVELTIRGENAHIVLNMSPDRAREFAADLRLAATHAEQGDAELGGEADE